MPTPLTSRNLSICFFCDDCISGRGCRYIRREIKFKPEKQPVSNYYKSWYEKNKKSIKSKRANPMEVMKGKARNAVRKAIQTGEIVPKDSCEFCGTKEGRIIAHHPNYNDFFRLVWCCKSCHRKLHESV